MKEPKKYKSEFKDKESQPSDNEVSYKNTSSSEISKSSISSSNNADNVASINLVTEESNVVNNASLVNEVDKRVNESVAVTKKEACSFKMGKPKMPKFFGDVREYAIFTRRNGKFKRP